MYQNIPAELKLPQEGLRIMGVDPGMRVTGVVILVIRDRKLTIDHALDIRSHPRHSHHARIDKVCADLKSVMVAIHCDVIGIEDYAYQGSDRSHNNNAFLLSKILGRVEGLADCVDIPRITIGKNEINNWALGIKGKASKAVVKSAVERRLSLSASVLLSNEHKRDAAAVAIAAASIVRMHCR
jgi:Holliday junction resolvasome RuvABC endonuclease subunit